MLNAAAPAGPALVAYALAAVIVLVLLIARARLNPFVALVAVSLALALAIGMPMRSIVKAFESGVGNSLGHIALVVGFGTMLGKMMVASGGADRIARTLVAAFGPRRVDWAMMSAAIIVGLPVFFEVGFVLLMPIVFTVARRTGTSLLRTGLPMVAGLSVVHALVPPHPAALLAVTAYGADIGRTILCALIVGLPTAAIAGPLFARLVERHVQPNPDNPMARAIAGDAAMAAPPANAPPASALPESALPGFSVTLFTLLLPVMLMLLGSAADLLAPAGAPLNETLRFLGNSVVALLLAVLLSFWTLGLARGFDRHTLLRFSNECLAPTAAITLVVGAGAGFGRILMDGGVSEVIVAGARGASVPVLLLGWSIAALLRIATGSATVAMTTAAGIVAPIAAITPGVRPELLVITTGAGAVILSHVNDGGFWLVKEYFGMTVSQTFKTWTVCETLISMLALGFALLLSVLLG